MPRCLAEFFSCGAYSQGVFLTLDDRLFNRLLFSWELMREDAAQWGAWVCVGSNGCWGLLRQPFDLMDLCWLEICAAAEGVEQRPGLARLAGEFFAQLSD